MKVGWVYHDDFLRHDTGEDHIEGPQRLSRIVNALKAGGLLERMQPIAFERAAGEAVARVHEPAYMSVVEMACEQGFAFVGSQETHICQESYDVAMLGVGGVLAACDAVMAQQVRSAFCAVRPPGHHAERDLAKGFCLFNNVAIAAAHLLAVHGLQRVAIVDLDVHHGNGTQHIFEDRDDVLYTSIHEIPGSMGFPGTGWETETGVGSGEGFTLNVCMPPGSGDAEYHAAFEQQIIPALERYGPQFLLLSTGFDAAYDERISKLNLTDAGFEWMTRQLTGVAKRCCGGRLVSVLEGGYDLPTVGQNAAAHVRVLIDAVDD